MGLASGTATVGRIGYEDRFDYTAIGSVVNLAARLCASASDGEILMDGAVAEAVKSKRSLIAHGPRALKGMTKRCLCSGCQSKGRLSEL